jgi:hypothetical protein
MTWVVGFTGLLTCGVLVGDVRVTSRAGHSFDGVQKIHLITPSAAAGFAGSVRFGLRAVNDMKRYAAADGIKDFRGAIGRWARRVRHAWERDASVTQSADLHLLVMTARPRLGVEDVEMALGVKLAAVSAYVLKSPQFAIEDVPFGRVVAIGSGTTYERLTEQLASIQDELSGLTTFELQSGFAAIGGPVAPVRVVLAEAVAELDAPDVSEHLHVALVRPDASAVVTFDTEGLTQGAPSRTMPKVATTEAEWDRMAERHRVADAVA